MTLPEVKKILKSNIVNDLGETLQQIESILKADSYYYNDTILQQGAWNGLKRDKISGILSDERITLRTNQIRNSVLEMISMFGDDDVDFEKAESELSKVPPPPPKKSAVYISYGWGKEGEEREEIVNRIYDQLTERGVNIIRDKVDLGYKGSIIDFMDDIGTANKIIVVISEKYLKSSNCMYELVQIYEKDDFANRVFPVVLRDANIYDPLSRVKYIKYWDDKIEELNTAIRSIDLGLNLTELQQELNNYGKIRALFSKMSFILKDMNTLKPEMHEENNFQILYEYLTR